MGRAANRKWKNRRKRFYVARTLAERLHLLTLFGWHRQFQRLRAAL